MTARKTTPHLKRGPKPRPKPPKLDHGRPEIPLREHPDRYAVARFDVAVTWGLCKSKRIGAALVHSVDMARQGKSVADLRKAGDRLRTMVKRYRKPEDLEWREAIGRAVAFTISTAADPITKPAEFAIIGGHIMDDAASVGEAEWARRELLPLIGLELPFALAERDLLTVLASVIVYIGWTTEIKQWMASRADDDDARTGQPEIAGIFRPA